VQSTTVTQADAPALAATVLLIQVERAVARFGVVVATTMAQQRHAIAGEGAL